MEEEQKQWLTAELEKEATKTLSEACAMVKEHTQVGYSVSAMHYVFKALKLKKKTGRPSHVDKDEEKADVFKKKLSRTKPDTRYRYLF